MNMNSALLRMLFAIILTVLQIRFKSHRWGGGMLVIGLHDLPRHNKDMLDKYNNDRVLICFALNIKLDVELIILTDEYILRT